MKNFTTALVASVSMLALAPAANAIVLDTFDGTTQVFQQGAGTNSGPFGVSTPDGIARTLSVDSSGDFLDVSINSDTNPSVYAHSQGAGVTARSGISWDLTGIDLTDSMTANAFLVDLVSIDLFGVIGISFAGEEASVLVDFTNGADILANGIAIPFSSFTADPSLGGVVELFIDGSGTAALDATIDTFATGCTATMDPGAFVPSTACMPPPPPPVSEPASLGLLGLGLVGMAAAARRRKA